MLIYRRLFAKRLKAAKDALDMSQVKLASILKVEPPTISRWENAHDFPDDSRLPKLLEALKITEAFLTGEDRLARPPDSTVKRLINADASAASILDLLPVLERFLNEAPQVRASALSVLYGDAAISRLYTSNDKANSR